ncbi:MAG: transglycosylase domain-containing protein [Actinobacteria bacterium]|nr:transglycosylase domain-containing protein [Actinomycetota bacterium]
MSVRPTNRVGRTFGVLASIGLFALISVVAGVVVAGIALPLIGTAGVASRNAVENFQSLPAELDAPPLPQQSVVLASDGSRLATLFFQNRIEVPISKIAPVMQKAIVAIEDSRFYEHGGIDVRGTMRAVVSNSGGSKVQGGSTLTQQYVKNVLVTSARTGQEAKEAKSRTIARKLKELRYALVLEGELSKGQILERYLNIAYFGAGSYGVEAAARRYFSTTAAALTLPQAATLAGLVQQPVGYDPLRNPRGAQLRRDTVLRRMVDTGAITSAQAKAAMSKSVSSYLKPSKLPPNGCTTSGSPFFCDYVLRIMRSDPAFGGTPEARDSLLRSGGLVIKTTLDPIAQRDAQATVSKYIPNNDPSGKATAISLVRPSDGAILAMAQNRTWGTSGQGRTTYNYNVNQGFGGTIGMQAGSTFKVFTLAAALELGVNVNEPIDSPQEGLFENLKGCGAQSNVTFPPYRARNSTGSGTFDMHTGTAYSVNTYFLALEQRTGLCRPNEIADQMGVTRATGNPLRTVPSQVLGTNEISPLAMAGAYAGFANHGLFCKPIAILSVTDRNGTALPVPNTPCKQVVARGVADAVASLLTGVIDGDIPGRTGEAMSLGRPAAGKTGTTNESAAVWFAGFTPDIAAVVWVGDPRGGFGHPLKDITINGNYFGQVFGSSLPGPIWRDTLLAYLAGRPALAFDLQPVQDLTSAPLWSIDGGGPTLSVSPTPSISATPVTTVTASPSGSSSTTRPPSSSSSTTSEPPPSSSTTTTAPPPTSSTTTTAPPPTSASPGA